MSRIRRTLHSLLPVVALFVTIAGLAASPAAAQSYWFEDYQRLVIMIDKGQHQEASKILEAIVKDHPFPIACMRVPGDRCIDYIPYYQRARIQLSMNNTRSAIHSLDISGAFGAVLKNRRNEKAFLQLRHQVEERIDESARLRPSEVVPAAEPK